MSTYQAPGTIKGKELIAGATHKLGQLDARVEFCQFPPQDIVREILDWGAVHTKFASDNREYCYRSKDGEWEGWICQDLFLIKTFEGLEDG